MLTTLTLWHLFHVPQFKVKKKMVTKKKVELGIEGNPLANSKYKPASLFSPTSSRSPSPLNLKTDLNALLRQNYLRTIYAEIVS